MSTVPDRKRTGHGFARLRHRYVRRADFLALDREFGAGIKAARAEWNAEHDDYRIETFGRRLYDRLQSEIRRHLDRMTPDEYVRRLVYTRQESLRDALAELETRLASRWFPALDFPNPYPADNHPGIPFIRECLYNDPQTLYGQTEPLFRPFELTPEPMLEDRGDWALDGVEPWEVLTWCIPVYPGMTVQDLRDAAPAIVERVNWLYRDRTTDARILALRTEGYTQLEIADKLGLTEQTVSATLKAQADETPENA